LECFEARSSQVANLQGTSSLYASLHEVLTFDLHLQARVADNSHWLHDLECKQLNDNHIIIVGIVLSICQSWLHWPREPEPASRVICMSCVKDIICLLVNA